MLFILFHLDADRYVLPALDLVEILPLLALKRLPGAPVGLVGLFDYRGTAVPVIDLAMLVLGRPSARRVSTRLLIVKHPRRAVGAECLGVMAERATEMIRFEDHDFLPTGVVRGTGGFRGPVARDARGLVQRVDVPELLEGRIGEAVAVQAGFGVTPPDPMRVLVG